MTPPRPSLVLLLLFSLVSLTLALSTSHPRPLHARHPFFRRQSSNTTDTDSSSTNSTSSSSSNSTLYGEINIVDAANGYQLNPGVDGNLFISLSSDTSDMSALLDGNTTTFLADPDNSIVNFDATPDCRIFYYYPAEMAAVSVSRIRLGAWGAIPIGTYMLTLVPFDDGQGDTALVAMDTLGNYFWLVMCTLADALNKVFIVQDLTAGPAALQTNTDLQYIVTGGVVQSCMPLSLYADELVGFTAS